MEWHEWRNKTGDDAVILALNGNIEGARAKFREIRAGAMEQKDIEYRATCLLFLSGCELEAGFRVESDADLEKALSIALEGHRKQPPKHEHYKTEDGRVFKAISAWEFIKLEKERRQVRK